jgi:CheY-like chemotaxis protein
MNSDERVTIVMVEDDQGHAYLIQKNLRRAGLGNEVIHLTDGQQALDYLFGCGGDAGMRNPVPVLILLDLNMPVVDGYQVLARIKANKRTRSTPVVVLTTTDNPQEISRCYELGCNVYVTKPVEYDKFSEAIQSLGFFLSIVKVPEND